MSWTKRIDDDENLQHLEAGKMKERDGADGQRGMNKMAGYAGVAFTGFFFRVEKVDEKRDKEEACKRDEKNGRPASLIHDSARF